MVKRKRERERAMFAHRSTMYAIYERVWSVTYLTLMLCRRASFESQKLCTSPQSAFSKQMYNTCQMNWFHMVWVVGVLLLHTIRRAPKFQRPPGARPPHPGLRFRSGCPIFHPIRPPRLCPYTHMHTHTHAHPNTNICYGHPCIRAHSKRPGTRERVQI